MAQKRTLSSKRIYLSFIRCSQNAIFEEVIRVVLGVTFELP